MRSIDFKERNIILGEHQDEYENLYAFAVGNPMGQIITKFQLNQEEVKQVTETGELWVSVYTFGHAFQPMYLATFPMCFNPEEECFELISQMIRHMGFKDVAPVEEELAWNLIQAFQDFFLKNTELFTPRVMRSLAQEHKLPADYTQKYEHQEKLLQAVRDYHIFLAGLL